MLSLPGPPFTHQQTPRKMMYYGQTSCEQDTERYLDVVKYVFSCYKKEVPLVINTMGWVKGKRGQSALERRGREVTVAQHHVEQEHSASALSYAAVPPVAVVAAIVCFLCS